MSQTETTPVSSSPSPLAGAPLLDELRSRIRADLEQARSSTLPPIAEQLGIAPRTLQRRLLEQGSSFRALVDEERMTYAEQLMRDPSVRIGEVVQKLGFSDGKSLRRAVYRWKGTSPIELKRKLSTLPPPPDADDVRALGPIPTPATPEDPASIPS